MQLFESLMLFLRATRQQSWDLHLASLDDLNHITGKEILAKYARLTPVYWPKCMHKKIPIPSHGTFLNKATSLRKKRK